MKSFSIHFARSTRWSLLLAVLLLVSACSDFPVSNDTEANDGADTTTFTREAAPTEGKLRHAHLLDQASTVAGKNGKQIGLVIGLRKGYQTNKVVERFKVVERYKVVERFKVVERYEYEHVFNGVSILADEDNLPEMIDLMEQDPDIEWIEPDIYLGMDPQALAAEQSDGKQTIPWGISRIGAYDLDVNDLDQVAVFLLDTGVYADDINLEMQVDYQTMFEDDKGFDTDGHGTHLAGIINAKDDGDGVVGVAPEVPIRSLRILGFETQEQIGSDELELSSALAALERVIAFKLQNPATPVVANLSFGADIGTTAYNALDEAIVAATRTGVTVVISAGNDGADASTYSPAHVEEAITVGAYDASDVFTWFSNHGPLVDILAPGSDIRSLKSGDDKHALTLMSGTSQAAAHVTGAVALYLAGHKNATPEQVRDALVTYGRSGITGTPSATTNTSVFVGDGGLLNQQLAPFFSYAITAGGNIESEELVTLTVDRADDAPINTNIFANSGLKVKGLTSRIEGFGYHAGGVDEASALAVLQPRYNPMGLTVHQDAEKIVLPDFEAKLYPHLATEYFDGDLELDGNYTLGTQEAPAIWYVKGKLKTLGAASFSGHGIIIVKSDIELTHALTGSDDAVVAFYNSGNFKMKEGSSFDMRAVLYTDGSVEVQGPFALQGSITTTGTIKFREYDTPLLGGLPQAQITYRPAPSYLTAPIW